MEEMPLFSECSYFSTFKYRHLGEENLEKFVSQKEFVNELNRVNSIAWPMIVVSVSLFLLRLSPMFVLGHFGELSLSSASMAITFCNVTGFSVIFGMASALETLCGQAYGAKQYQKVGNFTHAAIFCLLLVCLPISILWIFINEIFAFMGQDPLISREAGKYAMWLIPSLFPYAILQSLIRYLQAQNLIIPMLWSSLASLFIDVLLCWASVFKFKFGSAGAALSISFSYWINVVMLGIYVKYSSACEKTYVPFSKEVFFCLKKFFQYAVPCAMMVCLEWWCFELIILLSGILPNPQIEVNVLSISMTITALHFNIPYSFGAAARSEPEPFTKLNVLVQNNTRISNELGAGNPWAARSALITMLILSVTEFVTAASAIFIFRRVLGYAFINEKEVVDYIQKMTPLLSISIILDGLQAVLSGVARGGGWQQTAAYANLGAYYLVGIPVAILMGFKINLKGEGLWIGLVVGEAIQCFLFSVVTCLTDWEKQAIEARQRVFEGTEVPHQIELT